MAVASAEVPCESQRSDEQPDGHQQSTEISEQRSGHGERRRCLGRVESGSVRLEIPTFDYNVG